MTCTQINPEVGSVYLTPDGAVMTRAGSTFIDEDEVITKAGSTYTESGQTTTTAGGLVLKSVLADGVREELDSPDFAVRYGSAIQIEVVYRVFNGLQRDRVYTGYVIC